MIKKASEMLVGDKIQCLDGTVCTVKLKDSTSLDNETVICFEENDEAVLVGDNTQFQTMD